MGDGERRRGGERERLRGKGERRRAGDRERRGERRRAGERERRGERDALLDEARPIFRSTSR